MFELSVFLPRVVSVIFDVAAKQDVSWMMHPYFLCRQCGYEGLDDEFGLLPSCPNCGSREVVLAEVWKRYQRTEVSRANDRGDEKGKGSGYHLDGSCAVYLK